MKEGRLIVLTGATASGKTDIKNALEGMGIRRVVTATTRRPRQREAHARDYYFFNDRRDFLDDVERGEFVEHAEYSGNLYGTPKSEIEPVLHGENLVTSTEMEGAVRFKSSINSAFGTDMASEILARTHVVFIGVEKLIDLKKRFLEREAKSSKLREDFKNRLRTDWEMWRLYESEFLNVVINATGKIEETIHSVSEFYQQTHELWRQDDHGNTFSVRTYPTEQAALEAQKKFEARGHKQTYWVRPINTK